MKTPIIGSICTNTEPHEKHVIIGTFNEGCPGVAAPSLGEAQRARVIAAIHAMAQWLADNPDVPTPHTVAMQASPCEYSDSDELRVYALDHFAGAHNSARYDIEGKFEYAEATLVNARDHGIKGTYTLSTTRRDPIPAHECKEQYPCAFCE